MDEDYQLLATFDSEETAEAVGRAVNQWFTWIMEGDHADIPELFEDFGLATDEYVLDRDSEVDWNDTPMAEVNGGRILVSLESNATFDTLQELFEALGAFDVRILGEDEVDDDGDFMG
ncbi:MAG: hypothetical protein CMH56_08790 [Myxococcales bacterium]|mgnify:CR=1 FL=1|nr:hypothetical protein [Myxococcales bacterium]|tara:strand:+ start:270 stop:623 length:354 start_codon:yes stop_codon:yes gene_type:complete